VDPAKLQPDEIFCAAIELSSPEERAAYLEQACGDDLATRRRVERLLEAHSQAGGFLAAPPTVGSGTTDLPAESSGTVIGPYRLLQPIGEGGMGAVWMAEQTHPVQRKVALKIIKAGMDSRQVLARFEAERQALAVMDHPNIAKVLDGGATATGRPYFVMELVRGQPITQYCDEHRLTPHQRLELFVFVCQAIQHAHQKGIIHRDIKPSNVLVAPYDGKPVVKVIDFGVAKAMGQRLTEKTLFTELGAVVGTLEYMSPEQAELNNQDIDTRSDIYALGVLLYELLTGTTPLTRQQLKQAAFSEMLRLIREQEPPKPSTRLSDSKDSLPSISAQRHTEPAKLTKLVRGDLDWIVMKALEKDRNRRYETANGFARDLQRYLADEPVQACPPSLGYRLRKFVRRNRGAVLVTSAMLLALVAGMVGTSWGLVEARRQTAMADQARNDEAAQRQQAVEQRNRAEAEAAIARAVNDFLLTDLLGSDNVGHRPLAVTVAKRDPNIKVVQLLDRAAKAIETKFADQPLTEAAIRLTLGDTYRGLGRYEEARPHLERSVSLRTAELGADHRDALHSKSDLAGLYGEMGKPDQAGPLFEEVVATATSRLGPKHSLTLEFKGNQAVFYLRQGSFDRAEALFNEVLAAQSIQPGPKHVDTLMTKKNLAVLYQAQAKYDLAESMLKEALAGFTEQLGADNLDTLVCKQNLASLYWERKQFDKAEPLYVQAIAGLTAQLGADHPEVLRTKNNLATVYSGQRKFDEAVRLYREVLEVCLIKLGAGHEDTLNTKLNLAMDYQRLGKYDLAEPLDKEALAGFITLYGPDHHLTLTSKHNLAFLYEVQGKYDQAVPLFREALAGNRKKLTIGHPRTQNSIRHLIVCFEQMGQPAQAEPLLREMADLWRDNPGAAFPPYPGYHPLCDLGNNLLLQQRGTDAEAVLRHCLAMYQKKDADAWITFHAQSLLGGALLLQKKYADAEPLLRQGFEGMNQRAATIPRIFQARRTDALRRLVQLYDAWGKADEAAKWRKVLEPKKE
jgi:serine/threonine protein kinase/tetratricopeptide (TPR) repeat protein